MAQIKIKQVEGLQAILDALTGAVTSGSLKSSYTQNNHGFTPGLVLSYVDGSWVLADSGSEETVGRIIVESVTANTFVGVQQGTITVGSWNLTPGKYYLVDDSGTGVLAEYDPAIAYPVSNPVLQALTSTIGHVLPWRASVGAINVEVPVQYTQGNMAPLDSEGNYSPTGITMDYTPFRDGTINVIVNGVSVNEGDGVKTAEVYFSNDGGVTARMIANIEAGDELYWNADIAGFELTSTDGIDIEYQRTINA
jgi:hypothetical protein